MRLQASATVYMRSTHFWYLTFPRRTKSEVTPRMNFYVYNKIRVCILKRRYDLKYTIVQKKFISILIILCNSILFLTEWVKCYNQFIKIVLTVWLQSLSIILAKLFRLNLGNLIYSVYFTSAKKCQNMWNHN